MVKPRKGNTPLKRSIHDLFPLEGLGSTNISRKNLNLPPLDLPLRGQKPKHFRSHVARKRNPMCEKIRSGGFLASLRNNLTVSIFTPHMWVSAITHPHHVRSQQIRINSRKITAAIIISHLRRQQDEHNQTQRATALLAPMIYSIFSIAKMELEPGPSTGFQPWLDDPDHHLGTPAVTRLAPCPTTFHDHHGRFPGRLRLPTGTDERATIQVP